MSESQSLPTRRSAIKAAAGASVLAGVAVPHVHAQVNEEVKLALIGCGGRGTGAVKNALSVSGTLGPVKLHAMADVFDDNLNRSHEVLMKDKVLSEHIDVPPERRFIGFDGYRKAMDAMNPGDIAILTTPCAFRWPMFEYAVEKGLNVFMEKPVTADGYASRKILEINEKAKEKGLKIGIGLMCRHCKSRNELKKRIDDGEIGDITFMRSYRMQGAIGSCFTPKNDTDMSELMYQIKNFHSFLWLSGGSFSDFNIHGIDEMCMIKNAFPVEAKAVGGRHYKTVERNGKHLEAVDQNFDSYGVEYTFADGAKAMFEGRNMPGCNQEFAAYAHGTKGSAVISTAGHYDIEWEVLLDAIRNNKEHNEVERGVAASVTTSMGRMAAHTGQVITYDQMLNQPNPMSPNIKELTLDGDSPLMPDADGRYPQPQPGVLKDREYAYGDGLEA